VLATSGWGTTTPREYVMYIPEVPAVAPEVAVVDKAVGGGSPVSTAATGKTTQATGSTFVVSVSHNGGASLVVTDNYDNTYTLISEAAGSNFRSEVFVCENGVGGSDHQVTATWDVTGNGATVTFLEVTGAAHLGMTPAFIY